MKVNNRVLLLILLALSVAGAAWALLTQEPAVHSPAPQSQKLIISEICAKNDTLIGDNQGRTPDYVELYNPGKNPVSVKGCRFSDGKTNGQPLGDITLAAGEYRLFFLGEGYTGFSLSASGSDVIQLLDPAGKVMAQATTLATAPDQVMLYSDGGYTVSDKASPGFANDAAGRRAFLEGIPEEKPALVLSEVLLDNVSFLPDERGVFADAVELLNATEGSISLSDYWLSDDPACRYAWQMPDVTLAPGQYLVLFCDGEGYVAANGTIHAPFGLNRNETLVLSHRQGGVQKLALAASAQAQSLARQADGSYQLMAPSLGFENTDAGILALNDSRIDKQSPLVVSEVLLSQSGVVFDGALRDVVEITNRSDADQSTRGWYLSDGGDPYAYALPESTLAPGQCMTLVVSRDTTGFSLAVGESVYLTGPSFAYAPPVACLEPQPGTSIQLSFDQGEATVSQGPVSLGFANGEQGHGQWLRQSLPDGLYISEIMTANQSYLAGPYGKTFDWVELYNASQQTIDLSSYAFTSDGGRPSRYPLPSQTLAPGQYAVLILTDKTENLPQGYGVVAMTLSSQGDCLYLSRDGVLVDGVNIPALSPDHSYGRAGNAAAFSLLSKPTPGSGNASAAVQAQMPVAITAQGCYNGVDYIDVELSGEGDIYYTTDASYPGSNARRYTGPIRVTRTTVIRAQCRGEGMESSQVLDLTYLLNQGDQLDVVTVVAEPEELLGWGGIYNNYWLEVEIPATVSLFEQGGGGFTERCGLRMFGGYTRAFPKKSFACMFRDKYGASSLEYPLFGEEGLDEYHAFVLRTGGQDSVKGRMRDELITSLVAQYTNVPVQDYRVVTLYLNGKFWGVYYVREKVNENFIAGHYNVRPEDVTLEFGNGASPEYRELIRFCKTHDLSIQENYDYVASQVDIDEFIDFHVAEMWTGNVDMGNIKYFRVPGGKWTWVLYDTDLGLTMAEYNSVAEQIDPAGNGTDNIFSTELIVSLLENPQFKEKFLRRMAWQMETIWNKEQMFERIDYLENLIRPDMERDIARWNESLDFWNTKLRYLRYVVENRSHWVYTYLKNYFHLSDQQMQELGFQKY